MTSSIFKKYTTGIDKLLRMLWKWSHNPNQASTFPKYQPPYYTYTCSRALFSVIFDIHIASGYFVRIKTVHVTQIIIFGRVFRTYTPTNRWISFSVVSLLMMSVHVLLVQNNCYDRLERQLIISSTNRTRP